MAVLNPIRVDARRFHWYKDKAKDEADGSACISDLNLKDFERVYDDACDVGITIVGKREEIVFVETKTDYNDGDIAGWWLESVNRKTGRTDGRFKVLIIND